MAPTMTSAETFLSNVVTSIEPSRKQKEGAVKSHKYLRDILDTGNFSKRILGSYLSGSYARDTAINPLDDVDIIFLVDPSGWQDVLERHFNSLPSPNKILTSFAGAIRYRYPLSTVSGQRRSVCLSLNHLDIDVVPAIVTGQDPRVLKIPDVNAGSWILTAPKIHEERATKINQSNKGRVKPLIKILKFWNCNLPTTAKLKSFTIETIALRVFEEVEIPTLHEGLILFFDFIVFSSGGKHVFNWQNNFGVNFGWFGVNVPDLMGLQQNVAAGTLDDRKEKFVDCALRAREKCVESLNSNRPDVSVNRMKEALRIK